ncbi:MAG TPA: hypothetical protein VF711_11205, partial [Acidimicrobiales bacterium]
MTLPILGAILAGIAAIAVGALTAASGDVILLISVIVLALTQIVLVPVLLSPAATLADFLRVASLDARLLAGINWHPELTLTLVEIPDVLYEGRSGQRIRVCLQYKALAIEHRGDIDGEVELIFDPPVIGLENPCGAFA